MKPVLTFHLLHSSTSKAQISKSSTTNTTPPSICHDAYRTVPIQCSISVYIKHPDQLRSKGTRDGTNRNWRVSLDCVLIGLSVIRHIRAKFI